jgi:hypothetical protein
MTAKYRTALWIGAVLAAANAHAAATLFIAEVKEPYRLEPGQQTVFQYDTGNQGPDAANARVVFPLPAGTRLAGWSDASWSCARDADAVRCTRAFAPGDRVALALTVAAPDDPRGVAWSASIRIESADSDPQVKGNSIPVSIAVYRAFTVTTSGDFGAGSLRDAIDQANAACDNTVPCKIRFAGVKRIAPLTPLPVVGGCDLLIDGGGYDPTTRNRSFDVPRGVEISGELVHSGSGLELSRACTAGSSTSLQGLAIHSFPENGVAVTGARASVLIKGCSIGTDAAGAVALPNGLRGIAVAAPDASVGITDCLIAGNARSGVAVWDAQYVRLTGNLIGVRFGGAPLPNGGSGAFVGSGSLETSGNAIEYNHDAGIAVGRGGRVLSMRDFIAFNGGIAIDWDFDGPSPVDPTGRIPPAPEILDAFADPAHNDTVVRVSVPWNGRFANNYYQVQLYVGGGDHQGGYALTMPPVLSYAPVGTPFDIVFHGLNLKGQTITGATLHSLYDDGGLYDSSELSAAIVVR